MLLPRLQMENTTIDGEKIFTGAAGFADYQLRNHDTMTVCILCRSVDLLAPRNCAGRSVNRFVSEIMHPFAANNG
jgi:hypothetical protein